MRKFLFLLSLAIFTPILTGCQNNTTKYNGCIQACEKEKTCIERGETRFSPTGCTKYSDAECKNTCIEKYK